MRRGKMIVRETKSSERLETITESSIVQNDVLCGRGPLSFNHEGNIRYRQLIANSFEIHSSAMNKYDRACIVHDVTQQILAGGRFLREAAKGSKIWIVMPEQECIEKVSQAMRDAYKHSKGKIMDSTYASRYANELTRSYSSRHEGSMSEYEPRRNPFHDDEPKLQTLLREDYHQMSDRHIFQQHSPAPQIFEQDSSTFPQVSQSFASLPLYSSRDLHHDYNTAIYADVDVGAGRSISESHVISYSGFQRDSLTNSLDNTRASWGSHSSYNDNNRFTRPPAQSIYEMDSKHPAIDLSMQNQQKQHQQQPLHHQLSQQREQQFTEETTNEEEIDSFDDAIDDTLGPLQQDDVESAFKVD